MMTFKITNNQRSKTTNKHRYLLAAKEHEYLKQLDT